MMNEETYFMLTLKMAISNELTENPNQYGWIDNFVMTQ